MILKETDRQTSGDQRCSSRIMSIFGQYGVPLSRNKLGLQVLSSDGGRCFDMAISCSRPQVLVGEERC